MQDFSQIFENYISEAFRLETLQQYKVDDEWINFQEFLNSGKVIADKDLLEYLELVERKVASGKRHIRSRVFSLPLSPYVKFETAVGYIPQSKVGVEMNFIEEKVIAEITSEILQGNDVKDFWLFDHQHLFFVNYTKEGEFLDLQAELNPDIIARYVQFRNVIVQRSMTLSAFLDMFDMPLGN